jgi:hypothetical protein
MRTRLAVLTALPVLAVAGFVMLSLSHGQEAPALLPPDPKAPVIIPPARRPDAQATRRPDPTPLAPQHKQTRDLSKLKPLERQMYLSARRGAGWLYRMNEQKGRFVHGWLPALNAPLEGDHALRQAGAAFALARAAHYLQDDDQAARAVQAILTLKQDTTTSKGPHGEMRYPILPSSVVNRLSACALLVLAINELPAPTDELLTWSEQLCEYLRAQQQPDGSLQLCEVIAGGKPIELDDEQAAQYSGQALYALARSHERRPADWKLAFVRQAMPYYLKWWHDHKSREFACWHSAAYSEAFLAMKDKTMGEAVLEINDWVCGLQFERLDPRQPQWLGGFQNVVDGKAQADAPDVTSALCCESLAEACRVTRQLGDLDRHERYTVAVERGLQFLMTLQYGEGDTQHFADWYRNERLVGGFHLSHRDGNLRIDHTQHAVSSLVGYLKQTEQETRNARPVP